MALINCPECDCEVSDQAAVCPSCGYPVADDPGITSPVSSPQGSVDPPSSAGETAERRSVGFWDIISPILCVFGGLMAVFFFQRGDTKHGIYGVLLCIGGLIGTVGLLIGRPYHGQYRR